MPHCRAHPKLRSRRQREVHVLREPAALAEMGCRLVAPTTARCLLRRLEAALESSLDHEYLGVEGCARLSPLIIVLVRQTPLDQRHDARPIGTIDIRAGDHSRCVYTPHRFGCWADFVVDEEGVRRRRDPDVCWL